MDEWINKYPPKEIDKEKDSIVDEKPRFSLSVKKTKKIACQKSLDLHGMTVKEAQAEMQEFLKSASLTGLKKVLIIHGKGYHSKGKPVLKKEVYNFLEKSTLVKSFARAEHKEGGSGAVYVIIK